MSRKMMVDGKPFDMDSLFEDEVEETKGTNAPGQEAAVSEEWWKSIKPASESVRSVRPGEAIDVTVASIGTENILFTGDGLEGVISRDDFSADELAALKSGSPLRVHVVTAARKGERLSIEASREARVAATGGGSLDGLREAQAGGVPVSGKVTGENKGGFEVALQGAKGFVPFSQMELGTRLASDQYIGQTFQFLVTRVEGRNVVLSRTALQREEQQANQEKLLTSIEPGKVMNATVRKIESFGLFVELGAGLSALVPQSEASWSRGQSLQSRFSPGEQVTVKILKVESFQGRPRISASIKQADADPWDQLPDHVSPGKQVRGVVTRIAEFGAFVELLPGVEGLMHISEMSAKRRIHRPGEVVQAGQEVDVRILAVDRIKKRISVSMKEEGEVSSSARSPGKAAGAPVGAEDVPSTISIPAKTGSSSGALAAAFIKAGKK
ncbi:MAG: hypothetical protein RIQ81_1468 [Pseudomonadota bacterium]